MTMIVPSSLVARLRAVAEIRGQSTEETLRVLLDRALTDAKAEEELVAELRASVEDHAAGRSMTIDEFRARMLARRQERTLSSTKD